MITSDSIVDDGSFEVLDAYAEWLRTAWKVRPSAPGISDSTQVTFPPVEGAIGYKFYPQVSLAIFSLKSDDLANLDIWLAEVIAASMGSFIEHYEESTKTKAMRKHKRLYKLAVGYAEAGGSEARKKFPRALAKTFRTLWF